MKKIFSLYKRTASNTKSGEEQLYLQDDKIISFVGKQRNQFNPGNIEVLAKAFLNMVTKVERVLVVHNGNKISKSLSRVYKNALLNRRSENVYELEKDISIPCEIAELLLAEHKIDHLIYFDISDVKQKESKILYIPIDKDYYTKEKVFANNRYIIQNTSTHYAKEIKTINTPQKISTRSVLRASEVYYSQQLPENRNLSVYFSGALGYSTIIINNYLVQHFMTPKMREVPIIKWLYSKAKRALIGAFMRKTDVALVSDCGGNRFDFFFRTKNGYKYLDKNALLILYLHYMYENIGSLHEYYAVFDKRKHGFLNKMAEQYGLTVLDTYENQNDTNLRFLFGRNEDAYAYFEEEGNQNRPISFATTVLKITDYYKQRGENVFLLYKKIEERFGTFRNKLHTFFVESTIGEQIIKKFKKGIKIGEQIIKKVYTRWNLLMTEKRLYIDFIDKKKTRSAWMSYNYITKRFMFSYSEEVLNFAESFSFLRSEKSFSEYVYLLRDMFEGGKFAIKSLKQFLLCTAITIVIISSLFLSFFKIDDSSWQIFSNLWWSLSYHNYEINALANKGVFLLYALTPIFSVFFNAMFIRRVMKVQGEEVAVTHLMIGIIIGILFTNVTPLPVGGEFATYWYLRKKNVRNSTLIVAITLGLLLWNVLVLAMFGVFVPLVLSHDHSLFTDSPFLLTYLCIGITFNIIWFFILFILSSFERVQKFLINGVKNFVEWFPLVSDKQIEYYEDKWYYSIAEIRESIQILYKKPWIFIEGIFWKFCAFLLPWQAIFAYVSFTEEVHSFWDLYTNSSLHRLLNTISVTPGGSGMSEALFRQIMDKEFINKHDLKLFNITTNTLLGYLWPMLLSAIMLLNVLLFERIQGRLNKKELEFKPNSKGVKNKYTKYFLIFWSCVIVATIIAFMLL